MAKDLAEGAAAVGATLRPEPRLPMRARLLVWTMTLVAAPMFVSVVALNRIARSAMHQSQERTAELVADALASGLAGRLEGQWNAEADRIVDSVSGDPRVSMVVVTRANRRPLHERLNNPAALIEIFGQGFDLGDFYLDVGREHHFGEHGELTVLQRPIWAPPEVSPPPEVFPEVSPEVSPEVKTGAEAPSAGLEGFVLVGLYDRQLPELMRYLEGAQALVAAVTVALALPVVMIAVNRWTRPIRKMVNASHDLASGRRASAVPAHRNDEIGLLGEAFNHMAVRLSAAHDELRIQNEYLEQIVQQRTAELELANQSLGEQIDQTRSFIRAITHDLNAPLRNIDGMAQLLMRRHGNTLSEDALHKLERICANVRVQSALITDLVESNRNREQPAAAPPVDVRQVIDGVAQAMSHDLEAAGVELRIEGTFPTIKAQANRLMQVFQNLIDNAVKYMGDAPRRVLTVRGQADGRQYRLSVSDTGPGIDADELPTIFEAYKRTRHAQTTCVQGTGVGLATVRSIVRSYGGDVTVTSQTGQGTTFTVILPREMGGGGGRR